MVCVCTAKKEGLRGEGDVGAAGLGFGSSALCSGNDFLCPSLSIELETIKKYLSEF